MRLRNEIDGWHGLNRKTPVAAGDVVRTGERYLHVQPSTVEPAVNVDIRIVYEDDAILVVNKPAPLPMHPCGRFSRNTLQYFLSKLYDPQHPRPAHRLDANTSGLVLFTRTRHFAKLLQQQFQRKASYEVEKQYLARVVGHPDADEFDCQLPIADEPGPIGSRSVDPSNGLPAQTRFKVVARNADGTSLLQVTPLTGRTNQIRIHLWQLGHPVCGDPTYLPGRSLGQVQTLAVNDPPLCLLAWQISFAHPVTGKRMVFEAERLNWGGTTD
jgi:RluA family pseudouridine synthase